MKVGRDWVTGSGGQCEVVASCDRVVDLAISDYLHIRYGPTEALV